MAIYDFTPARISCPKLTDDVRRMMARLVLRSGDVRTEERFAEMLDNVHGGNDASVGCTYWYLFEISSSPREETERAMIAADVLRTAYRTAH